MLRKKQSNIKKKRLAIQAEYEEKYSKSLKMIKGIAKRSQNIIQLNEPPEKKKFKHLYKILCDQDFLFQAMVKISKTKGALIPGTNLDLSTADDASQKLILDLSNELKEKKFRFKSIKRIYIDKTGKNIDLKKQINELYKKNQISPDKIKELKARPISIPSFKDQIVQEAIRIILNSIYEPEFAKLNCNFGFRPGLGCHAAIYHIKSKARLMRYAIKGDVKGAFDNVRFDTLINILEKRISDKSFLNLILSGLKCGIIYESYKASSIIGTTQGSVVSPLLYNIYFHEFDTFIHTEFDSLIREKNLREDRKPRPVHLSKLRLLIKRRYNAISIKKSRLKFNLIANELKEKYAKFGKNSEEFKEIHEKYKATKKLKNELTIEQLKYTAFVKHTQTIRYSYTRYADDWIFLTNASLEFTQEIQKIFSDWIQNNLKLELSLEKTRITDLEIEKAKFLGFQLSTGKQKKKKIGTVGKKITLKTDIVLRRKKKVILNKNRVKVFRQRATNPSITLAWDRIRVLERLHNRNFITQYKEKDKQYNWRGSSKKEWTFLEISEIITRYNYIIRGYVQYYAPVITYATDIHQLFYLLKFSCAHTLAQKLNTTLKKIFQRFGKNLHVEYNTKTKKKNDPESKIITKSISILTWPEVLIISGSARRNFREKIRQELNPNSISPIAKSVDDICDI